MIPSLPDSTTAGRDGYVGESNMFVDDGVDRSRLIIAFTGRKFMLMLQPYDFFLTTGLLRYSRILLRDPKELFYLDGVEPDAPGFDALLAKLQSEMTRLSPESTVAIGTSAGGFAAILFGHLLRVDEVHVFGPAIHATPWSVIRSGDFRHPVQHWLGFILSGIRLPLAVRRYTDLRSVLKEWNGRTSYTIHVCEQFPRDVKAAEYLADSPHVEIRRYPCRIHSVANYLARKRKLNQIFQGEQKRES
jgi:hypothetical protein